jgi:hypothetical protein
VHRRHHLGRSPRRQALGDRAAGLARSDPGTLSLDAVDTITTAEGTITLRFTGAFDPGSGVVTFIGQSPTGTGRFAGVTGRLYVNGAASSPGSFESDVSGELCFDE